MILGKYAEGRTDHGILGEVTPRAKQTAGVRADGTTRLNSQWRIAVVSYFKDRFCDKVAVFRLKVRGERAYPHPSLKGREFLSFRSKLCLV